MAVTSFSQTEIYVYLRIHVYFTEIYVYLQMAMLLQRFARGWRERRMAKTARNLLRYKVLPPLYRANAKMGCATKIHTCLFAKIARYLLRYNVHLRCVLESFQFYLNVFYRPFGTHILRYT